MFKYASCFCEENVWWLCQEPRFAAANLEVVFISNPHRCCAMFGQRAASAPDAPVFWDYHVVLSVQEAGRYDIWDLDCVSGAPVEAREWLGLTFAPGQGLPAEVKPLFRLIPAAVFVENFSSDRAHMLDENGKPVVPFPSWPAIASRASNLFHFVDMQTSFLGEVFALSGVASRWST